MCLNIRIGVCHKELKLPKTNKQFSTSRFCNGSILHPSPAESQNNQISKPSRAEQRSENELRLHLVLNAEVRTVWILTSAPPYILIETYSYFQSPCSSLILRINHDNEPVLFILYFYVEGNLLASKWRYRLYLTRVVGIFLIFVVEGLYLEMTVRSLISQSLFYHSIGSCSCFSSE